MHLNYDANYRLTSVTDALGQITTIIHLSDDPGVLPDFYLIHQITDPFGRSAIFDYQNGQLVKIHDAIGITSEFVYATTSDLCGSQPSPCAADFIKSMKTPYGTTTFSQPPSALDGTTPPGGNARVIRAVDPTGAVERLEYGHKAPGVTDVQSDVPTIPGHTFTNDSHSNRNSFYWDKNATAMYPADENGFYDFSKAKLTQFLHFDGGTCSNIKEREKQPLEHAIYYLYPDQSDTRFIGSSPLPTTVARILDDGSTQLSQYTYNAVGKVTQSIDPIGRVTSYKYDTNNIDLLAVYQQNPNGTTTDPFGATADQIAAYQYAPDTDPPHVPHTYTDAAGQTATYTYNPFGLVTDARNARGEITHYEYSDGSIEGVPNGYLASITSPPVNGLTAMTSFNYEVSPGHFNPANYPHTITNDPDGYQVTAVYDNLDRPTQISYPDGSTQQFQYAQDFGQSDPDKKILDLTASKDRLDRWTYRHYDANRNMDSITDPLNQTTYYDWCACGALTSITDPRGAYAGDPDHTTAFNRDLQSRVTSKVFADGSATSYTYEDTASRLKSMTDANGQTTNYRYYEDDNLKRVSYTNALSPTPSVGYIYDSVLQSRHVHDRWDRNNELHLLSCLVRDPWSREVTSSKRPVYKRHHYLHL